MALESLRENGRINIDKGLSNGQIKKDELENRGARNKFWCNNYEFLYKEIFQGTYEDFAEIIASEIAKELEIECADYDFASYEGKNGVITKNFVKDDEGEELISGTEVINEVYQKHIIPLQKVCEKYFNILRESNFNNDLSVMTELQKKEILKSIYLLFKGSLIKSGDLTFLNYDDIDELTNSQLDFFLDIFDKIFNDLNQMYSTDFIKWKNGIIKANNLFDLWSIVDIYCKINGFEINDSNKLMEQLMKLFVYDIITSQGDRHSDNWSILLNKNAKKIRFSPIYDNSNMCNLNRLNAIEAIKSYIDILEAKKVKGPKEERTLKRLKDTIYHEISSLKVDPDDVEERSKNIRMMEKFVEISSSEIKSEVTEMLNKLSPQKIMDIFKRIEERTNIEIPANIKSIVLTTIKINIEELRQILNRKEVRKNGK